MKTSALALFVFILFVSTASAAFKMNDPAPDFSLKDRDGRDFQLSDVVGANSKEKANGVILSFFASWCAPCREELPLLNSVVDDLKKKGVKVVLVAFLEDFDTIREMLTELHISKPLVLSDQQGKLGEKYGVRFLPITYFIGGDGKMKDVIYGEIESEKVLRDKAGKLTK
jgi:peroxiredoxin